MKVKWSGPAKPKKVPTLYSAQSPEPHRPRPLSCQRKRLVSLSCVCVCVNHGALRGSRSSCVPRGVRWRDGYEFLGGAHRLGRWRWGSMGVSIEETGKCKIEVAGLQVGQDLRASWVSMWTRDLPRPRKGGPRRFRPTRNSATFILHSPAYSLEMRN